MVAWLFACCFLLQSYQVDVPAKISVEIPQETALEGLPIPVNIEIIRLKRQQVDQSSFQLDGKPIKVDLVSEKIAGGGTLFSGSEPDALVVSDYRFLLPARNQGLYLLPVLSVQVGGVQIRASQVTYQVTGSVSSEDLAIEVRVAEAPPIYPGQKVTLQYRILFRRPIELTKEEYALFAISGFRPIGSPKIENSMSGNTAIQILSQEAEAISPGDFHSGVSTLEGYAIVRDESGNPQRLMPKLQVMAPAVDITVSPFPEKGKPASFNGSIGSYIWKVDRIAKGAVTVGEKVVIRLTAAGRGDFDTVELPDIKVQKGFSGNFRLPDVLPVGQVDQNVKRFELEIRPLSSDIKEIPSIEFSSFDPAFAKYITVVSDPVPLQVLKGSNFEQEKSTKVAPIEIEGNLALTEKSSGMSAFSVDSIATLVVILCGLYIVQVFAQKFLKARYERKKRESSHSIFLEALKKRDKLDIALPLIRKALLLRLYEIKEISGEILHPEELSDAGMQGDVKRFLISIDRRQFSNGAIAIQAQELVEEASQLYYRMKRSS